LALGKIWLAEPAFPQISGIDGTRDEKALAFIKWDNKSVLRLGPASAT
jgi:hypothetical protein